MENEVKHIVNFSGGKDSTVMLIRMLEENMKVDEIIFCKIMATNTIGAELPEMYEYINKINNYIKLKFNKEITMILPEKTYEEYFYKKRLRGKRVGTIYGFPGITFSWCNSNLKVKTINDYLKTKGNYISYIGIAADEPNRLKRLKENEYSMLAKWNMTENDCIEFLKERNLENPLYRKRKRTGCWFCPKQNVKSLKVLKEEYPNLWNKLLEWQNDSPFPFRINETINDLETRFENEQTRERNKYAK